MRILTIPAWIPIVNVTVNIDRSTFWQCRQRPMREITGRHDEAITRERESIPHVPRNRLAIMISANKNLDSWKTVEEFF
jgi:hypothetical protein